MTSPRGYSPAQTVEDHSPLMDSTVDINGVGAIAFSTVATREPSQSSLSRPYGRVSTIAVVLLTIALVYALLTAALVVTP